MGTGIDLSILHLVLGASPLVQGVMLILLGASLLSWTVIFSKLRLVRRASRNAEQFEKTFWSSTDLSALYARIAKAQRQHGDNGLEAIFEAGFREFARLRKEENIAAVTIMEGVQRGMRIALNRENEALDLHLPFLATVGSTSPYIGLFGTVWGIMNSFRALGGAKQATLGMVAPGIAEALIATAIGLFAAIPAVIGYNRFISDVDRLSARYQAFTDEFFNILQRQVHK
ncbi:MAG: protein TolQ [Pseudomonadota bacterium]